MAHKEKKRFQALLFMRSHKWHKRLTRNIFFWGMIICEKLTYLRMLTFGIPASKSAPKRKEHIDNQKEVLWTEEQEPDVARNGWSWGWGWPNGGGQKAKPPPTLWQGQTGHSVPWPSGAEKTPNPPVWQHGKGTLQHIFTDLSGILTPDWCAL